MQPSTKLLILGFSVTEQRTPEGYAPMLAEHLQRYRPEIAVDIRGVGGIGVDALAYEFENFLGGGRYDAVLLDLTTTTYRHGRTTREAFAWPVAVVLAKVHRMGARAAMVHFWRDDVDYRQDLFIDTCDRLGVRMQVPGYNVARLVAALPEAERAAMFKDEVHTTAAGAAFYLQHVTKLLPHLLEGRPPAPIAGLASFAEAASSLPLSNLAGLADPPLYRRSGLALPYVALDEGQTLQLQLPAPGVIGGLSAMIGPRTGDLAIRMAGLPTRLVRSYDAFAYYQRLFTHILPEETGAEVAIEQLPGLPPVTLRKGEAHTGPRQGMVFSLLVSTKPRAELGAAAVRLLDDGSPAQPPVLVPST